MIASLNGKLAHIALDHVVVEVAGVGYKVYVPSSTRAGLGETGSGVRLFTHLHVREDGLLLYGFESSEQRELFELLLTVSGVGPKLALAVLSACAPRDFLTAVLYDDIAVLTDIPGIGKKTAQRLLLELKEKVGGLYEKAHLEVAAGLAPARTDASAEAVEALVSLGYNRAKAAQAIDAARSRLGEEAATEDLVKQGLKRLA